MKKPFIIFSQKSIPKDELLAFAIRMVREYADAAQLTHEKMVWILNSMINQRGELIAEKFYLFWWERRHFFFLLYHLRFYDFQVRMIPKGKVVLTFREYAMETGDYFTKEEYVRRLPDITSDTWYNLRELLKNDFEQIRLQ